MEALTILRALKPNRLDEMKILKDRINNLAREYNRKVSRLEINETNREELIHNMDKNFKDIYQFVEDFDGNHPMSIKKTNLALDKIICENLQDVALVLQDKPLLSKVMLLTKTKDCFETERIFWIKILGKCMIVPSRTESNSATFCNSAQNLITYIIIVKRFVNMINNK